MTIHGKLVLVERLVRGNKGIDDESWILRLLSYFLSASLSMEIKIRSVLLFLLLYTDLKE